MNSNKATLDYFDYAKGTYFRNIYAEANPNVVKNLVMWVMILKFMAIKCILW